MWETLKLRHTLLFVTSQNSFLYRNRLSIKYFYKWEEDTSYPTYSVLNFVLLVKSIIPFRLLVPSTEPSTMNNTSTLIETPTLNLHRNCSYFHPRFLLESETKIIDTLTATTNGLTPSDPFTFYWSFFSSDKDRYNSKLTNNLSIHHYPLICKLRSQGTSLVPIFTLKSLEPDIYYKLRDHKLLL